MTIKLFEVLILSFCVGFNAHGIIAALILTQSMTGAILFFVGLLVSSIFLRYVVKEYTNEHG